MLPSRIEKLRALAEHPTANAGERANALAEIARLKAKGIDELPPMPVWAAALIAENERRFREAMGEEEYAAFYAEMGRKDAERAAKRAWFDEEMRLYPRRYRLHWDAEQWTASLRPGDKVRTLHDIGAYNGGPLPSEVLTVARKTPTGIVVCTDGSKWNARGYKRGETGSDGLRTFIVAVQP